MPFITMFTDISTSNMPVSLSTAISPRLPSILLIGKDSKSMAELIIEAIKSAIKICQIFPPGVAEKIKSMLSVAGPAISGMASGTMKGSSSLGLFLVDSSSKELKTSFKDIIKRIIPPEIPMEYCFIPSK